MLFCCIVVVWYFAREYFRWARQVHGRGCGARNSASGVLVGSSNITPNTNANRSTTHQREKHGHIRMIPRRERSSVFVQVTASSRQYRSVWFSIAHGRRQQRQNVSGQR